MNRISLERVKSYILAILLALSLIQVGILWNYQNHGFPISILSGFFAMSTNTSEDIGRIKDELFFPCRIIVSEASDEAHWVMEKKSDDYKTLWTEAKLYLAMILSPDVRLKHELLPVEQWGSLVASRPFTIEFGTNMDIGLLKLFLDIKSISSNVPSGVHKMIISPWEDVNNHNTVYILDNSRVFKYILPFYPKAMSQEDYEKIIIDFLSRYDSLWSYSIFNELDPGKRSAFLFKRDIPVITRGAKYRDFTYLTCANPGSLKTKNPPDATELEGMADKILGSEKDNYYDPEIDGNGTIIFKNQDNIYRIYNDGLLEYKCLSGREESDRGNASTAFRKILQFLSGKKQLMPKVDFFLSNISEAEDRKSFEFTFDYNAGGYPVFFDGFESRGKEKRILHNAITIKANSKRVLNCWWIIKDFEQDEETGQFDVNFSDLMDDMSGTYSELKDNNNVSIEDIYISYKIENSPLSQKAEPVWVLKISDDKSGTRYHAVKMRKK